MKTSQIKRLDAVWSKEVKELADNKCEVCGNSGYLNSHHFIGRRTRATRWWLPNGISLCAGCHKLSTQSAHEHPEWFRGEMIKIRGNLWLKDLIKRGNKAVKTTYEAVIAYLNGKADNY